MQRRGRAKSSDNILNRNVHVFLLLYPTVHAKLGYCDSQILFFLPGLKRARFYHVARSGLSQEIV